MISKWLTCWPRRGPAYVRRPPLVLINGLAEQAESWYRNVDCWRRHFDVYTPNLLAYDGDALHARIAAGGSVSIDYLVGQLHTYLRSFVQRPPYHLVANSLGGKIAVEFAARCPDLVGRLVLLCPSGLSEEERLPVVEGVRRNDPRTIVDSVFYDPRRADRRLIEYYRHRFTDRRWRAGLLRSVQGTKDHRVGSLLPAVTRPTLLVVGREDRIVDPHQSADAAAQLPRGRVVVLPRCGHAPQIEMTAAVNRLVVDFLSERD
jgi:pimeloyl-ACP methyl ester carboxylesterase